MRAPADQQTRYSISRSLDLNYLVEAGAGTGKTTLMVERLMEIILSGKGKLSSVAAITFTEKAAAQFQQRLREEIRMRLDEGRLSEVEKDRCHQALVDLEGAAVTTIHSFACSLLRELPAEAGLDPRFSVLDAY